MSRVVYISGPMRGYPDFNYPAFHAAEEDLKGRVYGSEVINPAREFDGRTDLDPETYLRQDVKRIVEEATEVCVLPGWERSAGATLEVAVARAIGLEVWEYETGRDLTVTDMPVEAEARAHVYGDRNASYGHPRDDFARIAKIWSAVLGVDVTPQQVALCMAGVKISREVNGHKRDNIVDGIGYFLCLDRLEEEEVR